MASFLVTGGAGFIGSNIVEHLVGEGHAVRVLDNFTTGHRENLAPFAGRIDIVEGDLKYPDACARACDGVDYVLHQGALPSVPRSLKNPLASHEANATGTLNLMIAARDARVKRLVFASSSSVYGDQDTEFKEEGLPRRPMSPYAASKSVCEDYARAFSECFGLETVGLRYFNVFGPRQDPDSPYSAVIPLFINAVLDRKAPTIYGTGEQSRDFTYVENVVRANVLAATADYEAKGQAYNIACGGSHSLLEILASICSHLGYQVKPDFAPARVGDILYSKASIARAEKDLGYKVIVSLDEGLARTIEYYKSVGQAACK